MPVPSTINDLSTTAASNSPGGGENPFPDLDNHIRALASFIAVLRDGKLDASTVSAFMLTALNDADAATARTTLGAVGLTGSETVAGVKTFSSPPVVPTPAGSADAANKSYVDTAVAGAASALSFSALSLSATGTGAGVSVTAGEVLLRSAGGVPKLASSVSLTVDTSTVGANGLDTGTLAASTWYAVWVIWNGTTTAGLISLSATSPTMPSGYTHKARVGWIRTDGTANKYPLAFNQKGNRAQYVIAGALTAYPQMFYGTTSGAQAVAVGSFCPTTAGAIALSWGVAGTGSGASIAIGPSAAAAVASSSGFAYLGSSSVSFSAINNCQMLLESSSIYVDSSNGNGFIGCTGWEDNL